MSKSTLTLQLLRIVVVLTLVVGSLAGAAVRAHAQELDGGTFTDDDAGWSVEFDDRLWEAQTITGGLTLAGDDGANAILAVFDNGTDDPEECLEFTADDFADSDVYLDFESSRAYDAPDTDRAAAGDVYTTTYTFEGDEFPRVFYIECRALDRATLTVMLSDAEETYEDTLPDFTDLLAGIETGGGSSTRDETPDPDDEETPESDETVTSDPDDEETPERDAGEAELDGDTFTDPTVGYTVTFDDRTWEGEIIEGTTTDGLRLVSDFASLVIDSDDGYDGVDPEGCVETLAEAFEDFEGYSSLREERTLEGPDAPRDGAGTLYEFTFTDQDDEEFDRVAYIGCIPVDDETMVRISIQTNPDLLEDNVDAFQEVIDAVELTETEADETPERDETPVAENDVDAGELDGDTFTDTALGYTVTWDDRDWEAELTEGGTTAGFFLTTVQDNPYFATFTIDAAAGYAGLDPEECVEGLAEGIEGFEGYSTLEEEPRVDGPTPPRDGAAVVYSFTFTADNGDEFEQVVYVECRPLDDDTMIRVSLYTDEATLEDEVRDLQEILDSIEIDDAGRGGPGADEETPDPDDEQAG